MNKYIINKISEDIRNKNDTKIIKLFIKDFISLNEIYDDDEEYSKLLCNRKLIFELILKFENNYDFYVLYMLYSSQYIVTKKIIKFTNIIYFNGYCKKYYTKKINKNKYVNAIGKNSNILFILGLLTNNKLRKYYFNKYLIKSNSKFLTSYIYDYYSRIYNNHKKKYYKKKNKYKKYPYIKNLPKLKYIFFILIIKI